jgi:triacylglycerol lipase
MPSMMSSRIRLPDIGVQSLTEAEAAIAGVVATPPLTRNEMPSIIHQIHATVMGAVMPIVSPLANVVLRAMRIPFFNDGKPPFFLTIGLDAQRSEFVGMPIWTLTPRSRTGKQVVVVHGGGYVTEALTPLWWTYADMARQTGATVIVPNYPLIPKGTAGEVVPVVANFLSSLIAEHGTGNVSLLAESAGAGLGLAAVQELVRRDDSLPGAIVLESPWLDATVSDPASYTIDDPMLDAEDLQNAGTEWAGDLDPSHPLASPINGSLEGLPPIFVYTSTRDLLSPQSIRFKQNADEVGVDVTIFCREGLTHGWIGFPIFPEALGERPAIYRQLGLIS